MKGEGDTQYERTRAKQPLSLTHPHPHTFVDAKFYRTVRDKR